MYAAIATGDVHSGDIARNDNGPRCSERPCTDKNVRASITFQLLMRHIRVRSASIKPNTRGTKYGVMQCKRLKHLTRNRLTSKKKNIRKSVHHKPKPHECGLGASKARKNMVRTRQSQRRQCNLRCNVIKRTHIIDIHRPQEKPAIEHLRHMPSKTINISITDEL